MAENYRVGIGVKLKCEMRTEEATKNPMSSDLKKDKLHKVDFALALG